MAYKELESKSFTVFLITCNYLPMNLCFLTPKRSYAVAGEGKQAGPVLTQVPGGSQSSEEKQEQKRLEEDSLSIILTLG